MGKIDEQDETKKDEYGGTNEGNIIAPKYKEAVGDEKGCDHENKPQKDFRAPPTASVKHRLEVALEATHTHSGSLSASRGYLLRR